MQVIVPIAVTDTVLTASNVLENDYSAWAAGTNYSIGNRVIVVAAHKVYEAVAAQSGNNPVTDDGTNWLEVGATNRWKAFDQRISDPVQKSSPITYKLVPPVLADGLAFFGLEATSVGVKVTDATNATIYDVTYSLISTDDIIDWFTFYTWDVPMRTELLLTDLPAYGGYEIDITIASGGTVRVGQIVSGPAKSIGRTLPGTTTGITDFSRKDRDDFGNAILIERPFADRVTYQFAFPRHDTGRVKRLISGLRATPAVYTAGTNTSRLGTTVYGFLSGNLEMPLVSAGNVYATLEIEGLI